MATFWCDPVAGNDANTGQSFAAAVQHLDALLTWPYSLGVTKGDTINLVNSGSHTFGTGTYWAQLVSNFNGTSHDLDPGLIIQGTDSSGNPAFATFVFTDDTSGETAIRVDSSGGIDPRYVTIQGIKVDWSAGTASPATSKIFLTRAFTADANIRMRYCQFLESEQFHGQIWNDPTSAVSDGGDAGEFAYNYILNAGVTGGTNNLINVHHRGQHTCHHNVFVFNGAWSAAKSVYSLGGNDDVATDHRFYNNTLVFTDAVLGFSPIWNSTDIAPITSAVKHFHSNVCYLLWTAGKTFTWAAGSATGDSTLYTRVIGYNMLYYPNSPTIATAGWYQRPWDPDGSDSPEGTDQWATDQAVTAGTDPFNAYAVPRAWDFEGSSYSMTLPGDFRIVNTGTYRTMSQSGGVPGAISDNPTGATAPEINVTPTSLSITSALDDEFTGSFTIQNTGTDTLLVTSITVNNTAFELSASSASIAAGASLVITVTYTPTSGVAQDTGTVTILSNDSDEPSVAVTLTGLKVSSRPVYIPSGGNLPAVPIGPNTPAFYGDPRHGDPSAGVRASIKLHKNLEFKYDHIVQVNEDAVDSVSHVAIGFILVATNTAMAAIPGLDLTGLTTIMLMPDHDANFELDNQAVTILAGGCLLVGLTNINTIEVANTSLMNPLKVTLYGSK